MPFVSDIVGPQQPVQTWPPLDTGALRRTSTIDTHPAGTGKSDVELRARDAVARLPRTVDVLGQACVRAHLTDRVIDDIASDAPDGRLAQLVGERVGPGFRGTVGKLLPEEVHRASLLHLLLDDWVGASLVSGYGLQHAAITLGVEEKMPPGTADNMAGICSGFAPDASLVAYTRRNGTIPSVHGPVAPPLTPPGDLGLHAVEPLRPHGMRRLRRLDLLAVTQSRSTQSRRSARWFCPLPRFPCRRRRRRDDRARVHRGGLGGHLDADHHVGHRGRCGCCRGRSAQAPSEARRALRGWR